MTRQKYKKYNGKQKPVAGHCILPGSFPFLSWLLVFIVLTGCWPTVSLSRELPSPFKGIAHGGVWHITADRLAYDPGNDSYSADGHVVIKKEALRLHAERVHLDRKAGIVKAQGDVILLSDDGFLSGDRMELDLEKETGIILDGTASVAESRFTIRGQKIEKTGPLSFHAEKAELSTCDMENPDWKFTVEDIDITYEGYGFARHVAFRIRDVPVFYLPFLVFPVKQKRQTGFITPEAGFSDRQGLYFEQPFFWVIDPSSDATVTLRYMSERGWKTGLEYRKIFSEQTRLTAMFDYLDDWKTDDGTGGGDEKWGFSDDSALRPDSERYWLRIKGDSKLSKNWKIMLDVDTVSDQDFLHEWEKGASGFEKNRSYFEKNFGVTLDEQDDPVRISRVKISGTPFGSSASLACRWYDQSSQASDEAPDSFGYLPRIQWDFKKSRLFGLPLFSSLNTQHVYVLGENGTRGGRFDFYPSLSLPVKIGKKMHFEPMAGLRETIVSLDRPEDLNGSETDHREIMELSAVLSTRLGRVFRSGNRNSTYRHTITPAIEWNYTSDDKGSDFPSIDRSDQYVDKNILSFSLTNYVDARSVSPDREGKGKGAVSDSTRRILRMKLEQGYAIKQGLENGDVEKETFLPLFCELSLSPVDFASIDADASWSHEKSRMDTGNLSIWLHHPEIGETRLEYRYSEGSGETFNSDFSVPVTGRLRLSGTYERDIDAGSDISYGCGFVYSADCWNLGISLSREEDDRKFEFRLTLTGLGGFGNTND